MSCLLIVSVSDVVLGSCGLLLSIIHGSCVIVFVSFVSGRGEGKIRDHLGE